jgi:lipopolysaccharide export system protein LptA
MTNVTRHFFFALLATTIAGGAHAERADREQQVVIEFDRVNTNLNSASGTVEGNVILTQGTLKITAPKMNFKRDANDNVFAELLGSSAQRVTFREKREGFSDYTEGEADKAEFDQRSNTVKLFNRARITSGGNEINSDLIVYNTGTDEFLAGGQDAKPNSGAPSRSRLVLPAPSSRDKPAEKK